MSERELIHALHELRREIMGDLTALTAAVSQLSTDVQALITAFQAESDQPQIDQATSTITTLDSQVQQAISPPLPDGP